MTKSETINNLQTAESANDHGAPIQFDETAMTPYFHYWQDGIQQFNLSGTGYWQIMNFFRANWLQLSDMFEIMEEL